MRDHARKLLLVRHDHFQSLTERCSDRRPPKIYAMNVKFGPAGFSWREETYFKFF